MSKFIKSILLVVLVGLASYPQTIMAYDNIVPDINDPIQVESFVDGMVIPQMKKNHSPSGVVTLMKNGQIIFSKGYGYQDVEKEIRVDPATTLFRPGSISKLFTWVAVMQQVEQGRLELDADVNQYLGTFQIADTWPGNPITLRHIMSHTTGLEDGGLGYLIINDPNRILPLAESLAHYIPERVNPPGIHTAYSNWATALAGLIVANVSGLDFNTYVRQHIFDILEMNTATFVEPLPQSMSNNMAKSYGWRAGEYYEKRPEIIANFGPAGSLTASSLDMTKFAKALLNGGEYITSDNRVVRILEKETTERMLSHLHSQDARTRGMAHGFLEYTYVNRSLLGHDGATTQFLSHFGFSLEEDLMLFTSFSGPGALSVHGVFKEAFYHYFYPPSPESIQPPADFATRASQYVGVFQPWRANFTKIEAINGALQSTNVSVTSDNTLLIGDIRYVEVDKHLFREVNGNKTIAFQENTKGEVTGYITDGQLPVKQYYKAPPFRTLPFIFLAFLSSFLVFVFVILRRIYQRKKIANLPLKVKAAANASLAVACSNVLFVIVLIISVVTSDNLPHEIPWLLRFSFVFPILALIATIYQVYRNIALWHLSAGTLGFRLRNTIVSLCSVVMIMFYEYWNLLGFNYFL